MGILGMRAMSREGVCVAEQARRRPNRTRLVYLKLSVTVLLEAVCQKLRPVQSKPTQPKPARLVECRADDALAWAELRRRCPLAVVGCGEEIIPHVLDRGCVVACGPA